LRHHIIKLPLCISFILTAQTKNFIDQPYIEVIGSEDTLVIPNEIYIKIVISEKDTRDKISLEQLEQSLIEGLVQIGIDVNKNLSSSDMVSNFKYYFLKGKNIIKTKEFTLKVPDATSATKVFTKLEEIGISQTHIERVDHSDLKSIRNLVRLKAIADARTTATLLSNSINQKIGQAIHIYEENGIPKSRLAVPAQVIITGYGMRKAKEELSPVIQFEKIKVSSEVTVKFVLR